MKKKFTRTICGHTQPIQNIHTGKDFTTLPDTGECPICYASKKNFNPE